MSKNTGGAAFPSPGVALHSTQQGAYGGMTLRDYFACNAPVTFDDAMRICGFPGPMPMHALNDEYRMKAMQELSRLKYDFADQMLSERAK